MKNRQSLRQQKYSHKPITEFSPVMPYFDLLLRPRTFFTAWHFIFTVISKFFWIQQKQVLHLSHKPVIFVDTDLDEKIPFIPEKVNVYIGFVNFFVRPMDMLIKRLGYHKAVKYINEDVRSLTRMYNNAYSIYRHILTTTHRPDYKENAAFKAIHAGDPHLLCVPSLHVTIAAGTYAFFKKLFSRNILPEEEQTFRLAEIKKQALAIIESVLFVKQHSVNCIPTALYMLTSAFGQDFFSIQDATSLIEDLFEGAEEIDGHTKKEIQDYFNYMYERALLENNFCESWQDSIFHWLKDFAAETNQTQIQKKLR